MPIARRSFHFEALCRLLPCAVWSFRFARALLRALIQVLLAASVNRARNEQPDLIVMDIKLPDISGLDATLLLKKEDQTKAIPVFAATASSTPEDKTKAFESGCAAYIAKPVQIDELLRTVELFLPSSSP